MKPKNILYIHTGGGIGDALTSLPILNYINENLTIVSTIIFLYSIYLWIIFMSMLWSSKWHAFFKVPFEVTCQNIFAFIDKETFLELDIPNIIKALTWAIIRALQQNFCRKGMCSNESHSPNNRIYYVVIFIDHVMNLAVVEFYWKNSIFLQIVKDCTNFKSQYFLHALYTLYLYTLDVEAALYSCISTT